MAENGLCITINEFRRLPNKQKLDCLFENQIRQMEVQHYQTKIISGYKFWYRLYSIISGGLIAGVAYLFTGGRN